MMADDGITDPNPQLETARAAYAADLRGVIEGGGFPLLKRGGPAAIEDLLERSDRHFRETGHAPSLAALLRAAEADSRAGMKELADALYADPHWQAPEARTTRALAAVRSTLERAKRAELATAGPSRGAEAERGPGTAHGLRRAAIRHESAAEVRARTIAAIQRAQQRGTR